jgi:hypothetical protein
MDNRISIKIRKQLKIKDRMKNLKEVTLLGIAILVLGVSCSGGDDDGTMPEMETETETEEEIMRPQLIEKTIEVATTLENIVDEVGAVDYIVRGCVNIRDVLTIAPGVVIAFEANAGFNVEGIIHDGVISAIGLAGFGADDIEDKIIFTGVEKTPGYWKGITIETNDVRNELSNVIIEYAGSDFISDIKGNQKGAIALHSRPGGFISSLKLTNAVIRSNDGYGLIVESASLLRTFDTNVFERNANAAVILGVRQVGNLDADSMYTGSNGYNGVEIVGTCCNYLENDATWPSFTDGSTYYISSSVEIRAKLTLQPGAIFEFEANTQLLFDQDFNSVENDGIISAIGTAAAPITFTGFRKEKGYWKGLVVQSESVLNEMNYCIVAYAGSDPIIDFISAGLGVDNAIGGAQNIPRLKVTNSIFRNILGCGIVVDATTTFEENGNTFENNDASDICGIL